MEKIYGFRQSDLIALAKQINERKTNTLSEVFESFALSHGKAKGTVRNLYYALVRFCQVDKEFCQKYFNGKAPKVERPKSFSKEQQDWLISAVNNGLQKGQSVRQTVIELAKGDAKLALRYQNKFRSVMLSNPEFARKVKTRKAVEQESTLQKPHVSQAVYIRLSKEIDALLERVALKEKRQNEQLLKRISFLEAENLRLSRLLYGRGDGLESIRYFHNRGGVDTVH